MAVIWYFLLLLMALCGWHFERVRLILVAVGVLSIYGIIVFSNRGLIGRSHAHNRLLPWSFLALGFVVACTGTRWWFPDPKFDSIPAEQNPFELPLSIGTVELGLTPEDVVKLVGEPDLKSRYHLGKLQLLNAQEAGNLVKGVSHSDLGVVAEKGPRLDQLTEQILSKPLAEAGSATSMDLFRRVSQDLKQGQNCRLLVTNSSISWKNCQEVLGNFPAGDFEYDK